MRCLIGDRILKQFSGSRLYQRMVSLADGFPRGTNKCLLERI